MAFTPPTNPEDSYALSLFGFGPFPEPGESVDVAPAHPHGGGYGGVGFSGSEADAGTPYGTGSYGSRYFERPRVNISGGYGGDPYGLGGYGGTEVTPPFLSSAISLNGFEVELFFSEEVDPEDAALLNAGNYSLEPVSGAAPATVTSVHIETLGEIGEGDSAQGVLSVIITHTGTTMGGQYKAHASNLKDMAGNTIIDSETPFLAEGEAPAVAVTALDTGDTLRVTYSRAMLRAADEPGAGPGIEDSGSYVFTSDPVYPVALTPTAIVHDAADSSIVHMTVKGQTSLDYTLKVGPSFAYSYDTTDGLVDASLVETGTGSYSVGASYLLVQRDMNKSYGLEWQDSSGTIVPLTSTLRSDCDFDFSQAAFDPPLSVFPSPEVADIFFQDGVPGNGLLVQMTLQRNASGADQIRIRSGSFDQTVTANWSDAAHQLSFVRNMKAGTVTFLLDDHPLTTTLIGNVDGNPETQAGTRFVLLNGGWNVRAVRVSRVYCTSSTTVYSAAWNFVHEVSTTFTGSATLAKDTFLTRRGPLVKGWGDATPATKEDVTVEVNGTAVAVAEVNPYWGEVTLEVPVPLLPSGDPQAGVSVDYKWFKNPVMEMSGLNTKGLVLNKYDCPKGHTDPAFHGEQNQELPGSNFLAEPGKPKGAVDQHRFPMSVVLGPMTRKTPLLIGHRYMGYERAYSALTNSPTTLLLNQAPGRVSVPGFERTVQGVSVAYEGLVKPTAATPAWAQEGTDFGGVDHEAETGLDLGTYTLIDAKIGAYDPDDPPGTYYRRGVDLTYPSSINLVGRVQAVDGDLFDTRHPQSGTPDVTATQAEGVFTGVGFGIHDNRYLYLCGLLRVNGVEHVGLLKNPRRLHEWAAWEIGPKAVLTAASQTTGAFATSQVPSDFEAGMRFQVLEGAQVGVYTCSAVTSQSDGTTSVVFSPALPTGWDTYGGKYPTVVFETRHTEKPFTYRFDIDTEQQVAELRFSGETGGVVATIDGNVPALPAPATSSLLLETDMVGQVFWGSVSRAASSRSTWSFARYAVIPDQVFQQGHAVVINTAMSDLPEDNPTSGGGVWFPEGGQGEAYLVSGEDTLVLQNTAESDSIDLFNAYSRVEPFFTPDAIFDLRAKVQLDSGNLGAGDFELRQDDTQRQAIVRSLLYMEDGGTPYTFRRLINLPTASMKGFLLPETLGWSADTGSTLGVDVEGAQLVTEQDEDRTGGWTRHLDWTGDHAPGTDEGRIIEARLELVDVTANANGDTGIMFGAQVLVVGSSYAVVRAEVTPTEVRLRSASGGAKATFPFVPSGVHAYRVLVDRNADLVSLLIDDVLQGTVAFAANFADGVNNTEVFFGAYGTDISNAADVSISTKVEWHHVHAHAAAPAAAKRTLGVLKGDLLATTDPYDIDNYEIPRTDSTTASNSWQVGPVIEEMDWRESMEIRVHRDPGWGVVVYRPDMPLPPYYQAEDGTAGKGFITDSTEPSAGWINVEYRNLPRSEGKNLGTVGFGCFMSEGVNRSLWDWVNYRLFRHPTEDRIAPEHMVLNQFNIITSGELTQDKTLERVVVQTLDTRRVSLRPTHLYAESIYKIIDGGTVWTREHWDFDPLSQTITLRFDEDTGEERLFSAEHASVEVVFVPGKPITNTYLQGQPLMDGTTLLNEGTPPIPKNQTSESEIEVVYGSHLNDPEDVLNDDPDFVLNDPYRTLRHKDVEGSLYENLEFIEVDNGGETGLIASICEGGPGTGFSGFSETEGEDIYSPSGEGASLGGTGAVAGHNATGDKVGKAVGAEVFDFRGTLFTESAPMGPARPDFEQGGGAPGTVFMLSGGSFGNPEVDGSGNIIPGSFVPGGGVIGGGAVTGALLYPSAPAKKPVGGDHGRAYQRTDWFMHYRAVLVVTEDGYDEAPLEEDLSSLMSDATPPSAPSWWETNPDDTPDATGAASGVYTAAGDYSRVGPWGGLPALSADQDYGDFILVNVVEGTTVQVWDRVGASFTTFTARAVPLSATDFLLSPNPHTTLAAAIEAVLGSQYTATAGLDLSGNLKVRVTTLEPVTDADPAYIATGNTAQVRLEMVIPYPGDQGLLMGGTAITQSSLLAGGDATTDSDGLHVSTMGMVLQGGSALPASSEVNLTFTAA